MSKTVALRSGKDRLRYSITFEVTLMAFLIPAGAAEQVGFWTEWAKCRLTMPHCQF